MAFIIKDRVKEGTTSTGTGAITLSGASATFDPFNSYMTNGDTAYYAIVHTSSGVDEWEVGLGTWNTGNTLTRTTVLSGSNGTSAENFSSGTKDVFMTYPAAVAAYTDGSGDLSGDIGLGNHSTTELVEGSNLYYTDARVDARLSGGTGVTYNAGAISIGQSVATTADATFNTVTVAGDPTTGLHLATKEYVDTIASAGIHYHDPVRAEHPTNLAATYNNGSSGVGATLTNSGTNAAIVLDGVSLALNDRVLVANQTDQTENGVYSVTTVGSGSVAWVLTRTTDTDSYSPSDPDSFGKGDAFFIKEGTVNAGHLDVLTTAGTITFGTTNIHFAEVAETTVYSAGTGLNLTGTTFATKQDIATTASPTFDTVTADLTGDVTGDVTGNVTGNVTGDITGNADTATTLETARNIQLTGDVTGTASFNGSADAVITAVVQDDSHSHVISNVDGLQTSLDSKTPTSRTLTAGNGLTGGGDLTANRTFTVGAGSGITVNANDVAIDSGYTGFDNRYYTETEADSRFVNVTGDTMTGNLIIGSGNTSSVYLTNSNDSNYDVRLQTSHDFDGWFRVVDGGNNIRFSVGRDGIARIGGVGPSANKVFHDGYHPNADKWTTARTLSLSGDASGSISLDGTSNATLSVTVADDSHNHSINTLTDEHRLFNNMGDNHSTRTNFNSSYNFGWRFIQGSSNGPGTGGTQFYTVYAGLGNEFSETQYGMQIAYPRNVTDPYINIRYRESNNWGSWRKAAAGSADKWRTARTLSLTGDVTGSVSWDGSGNASLSTAVGNDSHNHDHSDGSFTVNGLLVGGIGAATTGGTLDWNHSSNARAGQGYTLLLGSHANGPSGSGYYHPFSFEYSNKNGTGNMNQFAIPYSGTDGPYFRTRYSGSWTGWNEMWHSGNDGSGSGLDADLLDGVQGSSYLRSNADDTFSGNLTLSKDGQDVLNFSANDTNDNRGISFNNRTALSADYSDGWLRINNLSEFSNGIYTPGNLRVDGTIYSTANIVHEGDTDTYLQFENNQFSVYTGGHREITVNTSGVRLGDTGNGYFQPVSGTYGSIQIDGGGHGGWEGYNIGGRAVFMHDNASATGIINDVENEWLFRAVHNGASELYHNGIKNLETTSTGIRVGSGNSSDIYMRDNNEGERRIHCNSNRIGFLNTSSGWGSYCDDSGYWHAPHMYVSGNIYHESDTNTYIGFHNNDQWRVVTGGAERLEVNSSQITSTEPIHAPSFHGDGSSLSGIASGANNDIFWENGQTVTSNYTITNGKNAMSAGPITINSGVTVTVGSGEAWTVV